ncbi:MAG TPA: hypothetical protein VM536_11735, partial [Chloroflexia bacterium]|nr:hypothetical protein [Chloroflexia bacterium]
MNGAIVQDLLVAAGGVLRAVTLPAGILLGGGAGAAVLLRSVGMPPTPLHAAAVRLARPLLVLLLLAALPLAVLETLWQTSAPLDSTLLIDLVPYMLSRTLFGVVWAAHVTVLTVCLLRLRAGHPPGLGSSLALLTAWPQIGHLAPNFSIGQSATLFEIGWLAAHRVGAALWVGTLAVLLAWSRP